MKTTTQNYDVKMSEQCRPEGHIKITLVSGSSTYYFLDSQIQSATRLTDIDPLSRRVPKETFTFSVFDYSGEYNPSNPSGKWASMDENAEISVQFGLETTSGNTEWLAADTYLLDGRPTVSGGIATFKASSKLCHLTKTYYKGTYGTTNLGTLAIVVLTDAGITSYSIDSTLSSMSTDAPLPVTTHLNCLQLIAHAARCSLRTVNGTITIAPFNFSVTPSEYIIGLDSIALNGDTISKIETLYKVDANLYTYSADSTDSDLYSLTVSDTDTINYHVEYDFSTGQTVSISGDGVLSNVNTYARCADFTVTGSGTYTVSIVGRKITTTTSTFESIIGTDASGSTDSEKNELITNSEMLSSLVYQVSNYLQYRLTHTVKYRGNPEIEPLDAFYFATTFGTYITALCLTHTLSYSGAFSGSLTLKSISELSSVYLLDNTSTIVVDSDGENVGIIGVGHYTSSYSESDMDDFIEEVNGS